LQEGIAYEAASLAGTLKLNKLIVLYDKNDITIEGGTHLAFTEDVAARHIAQGWRVITVKDGSNPTEVSKALTKARKEKEKPVLIICNTKIGHGSPLEGSEESHGAPLGEKNTLSLKANLSHDYPPFTVPEEVKSLKRSAAVKGNRAEKKWNLLFKAY
jgi:transketolase